MDELTNMLRRYIVLETAIIASDKKKDSKTENKWKPKYSVCGKAYSNMMVCFISKGVIRKETILETKYRLPVQRIQVDLCGSFRYNNFKSDKYFLTIRDAYYRYYGV